MFKLKGFKCTRYQTILTTQYILSGHNKKAKKLFTPMVLSSHLKIVNSSTL